MNQRKTGREKEALACRFLQSKGYQIRDVNYWCREAELDIVARDGGVLVFVEVKYRKNGTCGGSMYAVTSQKMARIVKCARMYIYRKKIAPDTPMRFDVIAIEGNRICHIENAFEAAGSFF